MKKHLILTLFCLLVSYPAGAQIQLSGDLSGTLIDTTYLVTGDIFVQSGDSLIIQPGAVLIFDDTLNFYIYGYLSAVGTEQDSIKFMPISISIRRGNIKFVSADDSSRLEYCLISRGYALGGGGISCYNTSPTIYHCTISGNRSDGDGGGIYCYNSSPTISNCAIRRNTANGNWSSGGGIYCGYYSNPHISHCTIIRNTAGWNGGGGGIYCEDYSSPIIKYCSLRRNRGSYNGGGIYCYNFSSPLIDHSTINENTADLNGGGIYCLDYSGLTLSYCLITENTAANSGGGIFCGDHSPTSLSNCIVSGNSADGRGGGILIINSSLTIENCAISGNTTVEGGAIHSTLRSNTNIIKTNIDNNSGYGIYFHESGNHSLTYCNVYNNSCGNFLLGYIPQNLGTIDTVNANGDSCDTYHNLFLDPRFKSTVGDSAFRLKAFSPLIDAGDPNSPLDPDSTIADIGAYYFDQSASPIVVELTHAQPPVIVNQYDTLQFSVYAQNRSSNPVTFDASIFLMLPSTGFYILETHRNLSFAGGHSAQVIRNIRAPGNAPFGYYNLVAGVGEYPRDIWLADRFPFWVQTEGEAMSGAEWSIWGEEFTGESADASVSNHPSSLILHPCTPNPFNASTVISFELQAASNVKLSVYDITGREVASLVDGHLSLGYHVVTFNGAELASGVYFAMLETGKVKRVEKMLLVK